MFILKIVKGTGKYKSNEGSSSEEEEV
jgi:hypothetical protein